MKRKKEEEEEEEEEEEGKHQVANRDRENERERVTWVSQNVYATVWGTWWCGTSTKFLTFQFFYCYIQLSPRCARMKIRKFFLLFVEIIVKIRMCSFLIC